jgi:hypothetical protein
LIVCEEIPEIRKVDVFFLLSFSKQKTQKNWSFV